MAYSFFVRAVFWWVMPTQIKYWLAWRVNYREVDGDGIPRNAATPPGVEVLNLKKKIEKCARILHGRESRVSRVPVNSRNATGRLFFTGSPLCSHRSVIAFRQPRVRRTADLTVGVV